MEGKREGLKGEAPRIYLKYDLLLRMREGAVSFHKWKGVMMKEGRG
jgi:hypothetical protein